MYRTGACVRACAPIRARYQSTVIIRKLCISALYVLSGHIISRSKGVNVYKLGRIFHVHTCFALSGHIISRSKRVNE